MFKNFEQRQIEVAGVTLRARIGGRGTPLLLLHGHPQTHVMWHRVAEPLARRFTVVAPDLRGYGDSSKPPGGGATAAYSKYSKRTMALDVLAVMHELGFHRFQVCAHDRGARVAHRLAADHPQSVERLLLLDIAPTLEMYEATSEAFARAYWHWFFLIQPAPLPERLIGADPVFYLRSVMGSRYAGLGAFAPEALAEYERCIALPGTVPAICEDYRASAGIDLDHDRADRDARHRLPMPVRVLWGRHGAVGRCFDVLPLWRQRADQVSGRALDCGHYIAEELPDVLLSEMLNFFRS